MADRTSAAADNAAWYNAINDLSRERGLGFAETDINGLITDSKRRGKSLADVLRRLDKRYPANGAMPGTTESTTPTAVASGTQSTSVFVPPPAPADDARRGSSSPFTPTARDGDARENAAGGDRTPRRSDSRRSLAQPPPTSGHHLTLEEHARWFDAIRVLSRERGMTMTDGEINDLIASAHRRGKTLDELRDRLAGSAPMHSRSSAAAMESTLVPMASPAASMAAPSTPPPRRTTSAASHEPPSLPSPESRPLPMHHGQPDRYGARSDVSVRHGVEASVESRARDALAARLPEIPAEPLPHADFSGSAQGRRRAQWRKMIFDFCEAEGLGQTESDVEDLLIEADSSRMPYEDVYRRLESKYRGYRAKAAAEWSGLPLAAASAGADPPAAGERFSGGVSASVPPASATRVHTSAAASEGEAPFSAEHDPYFHRIARLLHYHRAVANRAEAESSAAKRIAAQRRDRREAPGEQVYERLMALYGHAPPASWVPPPAGETMPDRLRAAEGEALAAASRAATRKQSRRTRSAGGGGGGGDEDDGGRTADSRAKPQQLDRSASAAPSSAASVEASAAFPDDAEAQLFYLRIKRYSKHHKLGQRSKDVVQLIEEQRRRGKPLDRIVKKLVERFGPEPEEDEDIQSMRRAERRRQFHRRIYRILQYNHLSPSEVEVNQLLDTCDAKRRDYEYVMEKLKRKYGDEPPEEWIEDIGASRLLSSVTPAKQRGTAGLDVSASMSVHQGRRSASASPTREGGRQVAERSGLLSMSGVDAAAASSSSPPTAALTQRTLAFSRLKRFALHHKMKRTDAELHALLDDAELRPGGYEQLFARLVKAFGPEPRGPGATLLDGPAGMDADEERQLWRMRLQVYCSHYNLRKTDRDIDDVLDKYAQVGWDVLMKQLEERHGPAPWPKQGPLDRQARSPAAAAAAAAAGLAPAHWNAGGAAPSPSFTEEGINAQRREVLRRVSDHFRLQWDDKRIASLVQRHHTDFDALLTAIERQHGPIPEVHLRGAPPEHMARRRGDGSVNAGVGGGDGGASRGVLRGLITGDQATAGGTSAIDAYAYDADSWRRRVPPVPVAYSHFNQARFEAEWQFWSERVRNLFEVHNPAYANEEDVTALMRRYVDRGVSFERMWGELIAKYGPEPASLKSRDSTRNYWKAKFKHYCEHYKMPKSDTELERMMDEFELKGWARMYDRLVELHGPPPPLPPTNLVPDQKMTPAQWRERLRSYCRTKFPWTTADQIDLYLDQFEKTSGSLENVYATLVLLHGLEATGAAAAAAVGPQQAPVVAAAQFPAAERSTGGLHTVMGAPATVDVGKIVRDNGELPRHFTASLATNNGTVLVVRTSRSLASMRTFTAAPTRRRGRPSA
jgi:hypothetical protein